MNPYQKQIKYCGFGLLGVCAFTVLYYVMLLVTNFDSFLAAIGQNPAVTNAGIDDWLLVIFLSVLLVGGFPLVMGILTLFFSSREGKWVGSFVCGILIVVFSIPSFLREITNISLLTLPAIAQPCLGGWIIRSANLLQKEGLGGI